jgi:hypothetical protein
MTIDKRAAWLAALQERRALAQSRIEELGATATAIAQALEPGWAAAQDEGQSWAYARLAGPAGELLMLRDAEGSGRLEVLGCAPEGTERLLGKTHRITVSSAKPAQRIAAEIGRRLLPGYREDCARTAAFEREAAAREEAARLLAKELAAIVGDAASTSSYKYFAAGLVEAPVDGGKIVMSTEDGQSVRLGGTVSPSLAREIAAFVASAASPARRAG